jgi:hypothetical protein
VEVLLIATKPFVTDDMGGTVREGSPVLILGSQQKSMRRSVFLDLGSPTEDGEWQDFFERIWAISEMQLLRAKDEVDAKIELTRQVAHRRTVSQHFKNKKTSGSRDPRLPER